jgi:hypothetical protein
MPAIKTVRPAVPVPPEIVERPGKSAPDNPLAFLSTEIQPINRKTEPVGTGWLSRRSLLVVALTVVIVTAAVALVSIVLNNYRSDAASHSPSTTPSTDEAMDAP